MIILGFSRRKYKQKSKTNFDFDKKYFKYPISFGFFVSDTRTWELIVKRRIWADVMVRGMVVNRVEAAQKKRYMISCTSSRVVGVEGFEPPTLCL